ncbi:TetR/AcrR family transcriptional regulator [Bacillus atrophaeus]|uniref:TetR/AcrR family transcriptional regulator n=1 Tax=Bacillus atrophaeus TaxID=1452 RepID=UPI000B456DC4|nr:TetR/AcrR family transcriptional regulator [Bacillus atrophaeus]ARW07617.1 putative HTH-type transcriptional regulator YxbF [Bacillus atrophaeus]ASS71978.1 TetR/AcrR family transcriptional regulator [Bacillus atrophaeus]ATO28199.1 TetR/AcrR family transcriptional regulator [Bacillus atrophaeus]MCY8912551.1 TetR/AcrR family transcriptional regulator [Bacillus atrophaeus]MCY9107497.1 TetR/AcrR family transcriptional regulator [Bacillus atrophaeus]
MGDRRSIKTKSAIKHAFLKLLHEKEINKITVSDLSKKADIGRGTFYLHYKDVFDLYEQIEDEIFEQLGSFYDSSFPSEDPLSMLTFIEKTTEYIYQNVEIFTLLTKPKMNVLSTNKLKEFFKTKVIEELSMLRQSANSITETEKFETTFIVSGVVGIIEEWINNGMIKTPTCISNIIHQLLLKFED